MKSLALLGTLLGFVVLAAFPGDSKPQISETEVTLRAVILHQLFHEPKESWKIPFLTQNFHPLFEFRLL